ncbi:DUF2203 domain-containing protein [Hyalangium rubrum]|uniref:DUF2203 domain-containing protein n=1 Tax=Hyalangium rubrum TaxID=3103134 RepID=A0ABU5HAG4_9BACT|nr:DUF2203 domain-containing protein [Hyalangium sp. s54d21]MDY7230079.1 DUF2203 domain-containing protein [Hyalangium sp. s54d21]
MRYFSVNEASRLIPLLNQTFEKVRPWVERAQQLGEELASLRSQGTRDAHTEVLREQHDGLIERIRAELRQLQDMGIEVKAADGLVDFRAQLGGRTVYLCWRYGESAIAHWHELETGFAGRQRIEDPEVFAPTYLS